MSDIITMAHGSGGVETDALIRDVFSGHLGNDMLNRQEDGAVFDICGRVAYTTDSFVVTPMVFPGGNIGMLSVCGTVNDLAMMGAQPRYISAGFIIETGMPICELQAIARSMGETARAAGVTIAAADTKVIEGTGGIYINTSGIGIIPEGRAPHANKCRAGDVLIVSGNLGDHHACIMSARMGIENDIKSDAAPLTKQVEALYSAGVSPRAMRDVTRGGLGTVLNELANASHCACTLFESAIPIASSTRALCDILGLDPLYMGNEGTFITAVAPDESEKALEVLKKFGNAAIIGEFCTGEHVRIRTEFGGVRVVPPLYGEGLPRIC